MTFQLTSEQVQIALKTDNEWTQLIATKVLTEKMYLELVRRLLEDIIKENK